MNAVVQLKQPEIFQVPYWEIKRHWGRATPLVQKALDVTDEWTLDAVYRAVSVPASNCQLWLIPYTFALVTQIQTFPTGVKKCLMFLGGGEGLEAIRHAQYTVEPWAKEYFGCSKSIIYGRKGFSKKLDGYGIVASVMEKEL